MSFGNLKTEAGVKALNEYLADKSYIEGYEPSQADASTYNALAKSPNAKFPHALRWYNHIKSYGKEINNFKKSSSSTSVPTGAGEPQAPVKNAAADDDDDIDLFGSDDDADGEAEKLKQERLKQYEEKKSKKPGPIAKSSVVLDVKPWDDETDMVEMERLVRTIECDGLKWGAARLMPLAYGIKKLQIMCVVEDEKVSIDWLQEEIQQFEDHVQSVDIAAFQKI